MHQVARDRTRRHRVEPGVVELAVDKPAAIGSGYRRKFKHVRVAQPGLRHIDADIDLAGLRGTGKQYGSEKCTRLLGQGHDSLDQVERWWTVWATQTRGVSFQTMQSFERIWPDRIPHRGDYNQGLRRGTVRYTGADRTGICRASRSRLA